MGNTIRVGIVGTGGMANHHARTFKKIPGVRLTSCLDVVPGRAEAFAKEHGVASVAKNLRALLREVDAVAIVTPDRFHAGPAIAALSAGKHLLCEKPLTVTLAEARKVARAAAAAERRGVVHMTNFSYRRSAAMQKAIALSRGGKLGELRHVHSFYLQSWLAQPAWGHWTGEAWLWRLRTAAGSGGVLGDIGCHILDLTTAVSDELEAVRCELATFPKITQDGKRVGRYHGKVLDANDSAIIELRFAGGALGVVHTTRWAAGHHNHLRCEVHGTKGALRFDLDADYDAIETCLGKDMPKAAWTATKLKPTPDNHQRFIRAIRTGKREQPDIFRGAQVQAYLDACERSAKTGRWERVAAWR
jgi:predicted dehydrogenase